MPDWLRDSFTLGGPFVSAMVIYVLTRFHERNKTTLRNQDKVLKSISDDVRHIDDCLDDVKQRVSRLEGWRLWGRPSPVEKEI